MSNYLSLVKYAFDRTFCPTYYLNYGLRDDHAIENVFPAFFAVPGDPYDITDLDFAATAAGSVTRIFGNCSLSIL